MSKYQKNTIGSLSEEKVWEALLQVMDPEIPVISVVDMGMITGVKVHDEGKVEVNMTPTFSGCPAIKYIQDDIHDKVKAATGAGEVIVNVNFEVMWTSDRITEEGRKALKEFGLAPPPESGSCFSFDDLQNVECPRCESKNTVLKSPFGATLCRAMHYCYNCQEAFEQFKPVK